MKFPSSPGSLLSTMNMSVVKRLRILPDGFVSTHFNGARRIACVILSNKTFDVRRPMAVIVIDLATYYDTVSTISERSGAPPPVTLRAMISIRILTIDKTMMT